MTKRKIEYWVIPPNADGEFVACMEEVLETYEKPYDPDRPVVCMDEQPVQLIGETRMPIPATKEHPERVDYEYERKGQPASSCSPNHSLVSAKRQPGLAAPRTIGLTKSLICWTPAMQRSIGSRWSATT